MLLPLKAYAQSPLTLTCCWFDLKVMTTCHKTCNKCTTDWNSGVCARSKKFHCCCCIIQKFDVRAESDVFLLFCLVVYYFWLIFMCYLHVCWIKLNMLTATWTSKHVGLKSLGKHLLFTRHIFRSSFRTSSYLPFTASHLGDSGNSTLLIITFPNGNSYKTKMQILYWAVLQAALRALLFCTSGTLMHSAKAVPCK